jgi:hypothetical protein
MNAKITEYLATKVGEQLPPVSIKTGNESFVGAPYMRVYHAQVIVWDAERNWLTVWITTRDHAPNDAWCETHGESPDGEYSLKISNRNASTLSDIWQEILRLADPALLTGHEFKPVYGG